MSVAVTAACLVAQKVVEKAGLSVETWENLKAAHWEYGWVG